MRHGECGGGSPLIVLVPPLFDEANRTRRTLVQTMRALAERGLDSMLPDLPGQNESLVPTETVTLADWRTALAASVDRAGRPTLIASWRGGALIDDTAVSAIGWWRMAPSNGASLVKTMIRTRIAGEKEAGRAIIAEDIRKMADQGPVELAGTMLNGAMLAQLESATPAVVQPLRQVALGTGDGKLPGSALWLRAEPGEDAAMARAMAEDIHAWAITCAAG